ncbi:MAG: helix-turn-helix transcriptional regulator [Neisseriaceae bacterium]|nr:helix-turn-helix transcriptional regulator [Neisseriaceae bacterium]
MDTETGVPSAVVNLAFDNGYSALRAWREYLGFTQEEVAKKLMISQSAYCQQEKNDTLTNAFRERVAIVLNIHPEQLNF